MTRALDRPATNTARTISKSNTINEAIIEQHLRRRAEEHAVMCLKFTSPGNSAVPDRVLIGTHLRTGQSHTVFVETKAPGEKPRPDQMRMFRRMSTRGATVYVVDSTAAVDEVLHLVYGIEPVPNPHSIDITYPQTDTRLKD